MIGSIIFTAFEILYVAWPQCDLLLIHREDFSHNHAWWFDPHFALHRVWINGIKESRRVGEGTRPLRYAWRAISEVPAAGMVLFKDGPARTISSTGEEQTAWLCCYENNGSAIR